MSTVASGHVPEPALLHSVTLLLQQLVAGIEKLKQSRKPPTLPAELALASTRLRQLQEWLPAQHDLSLTLRKLHKLLPALLQPQEPAATVRLLAMVYRMQHTLQAAMPADLASYRASAGPLALVPLTQLWRWQQGAPADNAALLQPLLCALLQQLETIARQSTPAAAAPGALLQRMQALLEFAATPEEKSAFSELAQTVSLVIMQGSLFSRGEQIACWQALWSFVQRRQLPEVAVTACHDLELLQVAQLDLGRHRRQLQLFLQQAEHRVAAAPVLLPYTVMLLHYRLPWVLAAVGQSSLSRLCRLWYQCLTVHWLHRLPLANTQLMFWHNLLRVLDLADWPALSPGLISRWQWQLLQQWPLSPERQVACVAFVGVREGEDETIPVDGIPEWLARAFRMLAEAVVAEWFADADQYLLHVNALTSELLLLEQGAAAIKLQSLENYCGLLLALHQSARQSAINAVFSGDLLWRAHVELRDLLDQVAAWQEAVPDAQLVQEIKQRLQQPALPLPLAATVTDPSAAMLERVRSFVESLAESVEQPLRLSVELVHALPESALAACEQALIAMLRFLVLEQVQNVAQRRQALKPLAATLLLKLETTEDGIAVELTEAGLETAPDAQTLKRLRHKLPEAVQRLYCRTVPGRGRSFRFVI